MDKKVIVDAALGSTRAFKKIFDHFLPRMRPVALRYAHTDFEADDILQESFVKIFRHLKEFKHEGSFEGWVRRIVVNTAITHYKKNANFYDISSVDDLSEAQTEKQFVEIVEEMEPSMLMKLINELPEGYRMVFNLYVFEDLSHKEIAEILKITDGTSRSQYSKAKKLLKKMYFRQQNDQKNALLREGN